jgi:zinc protease
LPTNVEKRTERYRLPSGAKVALLPKKTRGASVQVVVSLHFGTQESLAGKSSAASMAGQLLMRGTVHRNRQQLQDELDRLKARMGVGGGAQGASASIETTRDNLPAVLRLAAEVLKEPAFPAADFEQIRAERLTYLELGRSDPQALASNRLFRALYPYPRGDVRAVPSLDEQIEDLKSVTLAQTKAFYQAFYGASAAEVAVVGDFDVAQVKAVLDSQFGAWKSPSPYQRVLMGAARAAPIDERIETPDKANASFFASERLDVQDDDPDYAALMLGNHLLGGGFLNSRLATRIRVKEGLSYGIGSSLSASSDERNGRFQGYAIAAPQNVAKVEAAFKEELARALKDGFSAQEVAAGRAGWLQSQQVARSSDATLARLLVAQDHDDRTFAWDQAFEDRVRAATPEAIVEAMRRRIDPARLSIVKAGDFKKAAAL